MTDLQPIEGRADLTGREAQLICDWTELEDPHAVLAAIAGAFPDFPRLAEWRDALEGVDDMDSREWDMIEHCVNQELVEAQACDWQDPERLCFSFDLVDEGAIILAPLSWWHNREAEADKLREQWALEQQIKQRNERRGMKDQIGLF